MNAVLPASDLLLVLAVLVITALTVLAVTRTEDPSAI